MRGDLFRFAPVFELPCEFDLEEGVAFVLEDAFVAFAHLADKVLILKLIFLLPVVPVALGMRTEIQRDSKRDRESICILSE